MEGPAPLQPLVVVRLLINPSPSTSRRGFSAFGLPNVWMSERTTSAAVLRLTKTMRLGPTEKYDSSLPSRAAYWMAFSRSDRSRSRSPIPGRRLGGTAGADSTPLSCRTCLTGSVLAAVPAIPAP